jgi:hypothetical protein
VAAAGVTRTISERIIVIVSRTYLGRKMKNLK